MGREVKRVSTDFDWPSDKIWEGYLNPHFDKKQNCPECDGSGSSPDARVLKDQWYGNAPFKPEDRDSTPFTTDHPFIRASAENNVLRAPVFYGIGEPAIISEAARLADLFNSEWMHHVNADDVAALVESKRLIDFTHTWDPKHKWVKKNPPYIPTPEEVNNWSISLGTFGHDSINQWVVVSAECERLGIDPLCQTCNGDGDLWLDQADKKAYDEWEPVEPPVGNGWQVWETVTEGSPITPVFETDDELVNHLVDIGDAWDQRRSSGGWDRAAAIEFVSTGHAFSMIMEKGVLRRPGDAR